MTLSRGLSALGVRNYRLFWSGQLISLVGTWMDSVAQSWLILLITNDPVALGLRAVFQFTPVLVLGLFGGIIADTLPKRATLYVTQAGSGLVALTLGVLTLSGTVQVWHIYVLATILGTISAVDMPVRQSFVVEMVGREHVVNAVALNSATFNGARIIGPAVGGVLIGAVGVGLCFMLNAASYLAVLAALFLMHEGELHPAIRLPVPHSPRAVVDQLAEGLRYVRRTPSVFLAILVLGIVSTVALNFSVVMPLYAAETLHGDASTYGYLMAAAGVGSLAAALLIAFGMRPTLRLLVAGSALIGIALVALAVSPVLLVSLPIMVLLGFATITMSATTNTLIQLQVPDALRGRVMSVYTTVFSGSTPIGGLASGVMAGIAGVTATLAVAGGLTLLTAGAAVTRLSGTARAGATPVPPEPLR
ncbi:MAG TPA: MFS transporter [Candidatus Baltobacteraceae bacterium]|nr:MFS transporter [Candidatus Baltobacteraceae bacterium]